MRKRYSPELKTQIVLQALREEKTIAQLASEHEVLILPRFGGQVVKQPYASVVAVDIVVRTLRD